MGFELNGEVALDHAILDRAVSDRAVAGGCSACNRLMTEYERLRRKRDNAFETSRFQSRRLAPEERARAERNARFADLDVQIVLIALSNHRRNHPPAC
jgi:hypothetical protein